MLIVTSQAQIDVEAVDQFIRQHESLLEDARNLRIGRFPAPERLDRSPLVNNWFLCPGFTKLLYGRVQHQPRFGDLSPMEYSEVVIYAKEFSWARTRKGLVRLGNYAPPNRFVD